MDGHLAALDPYLCSAQNSAVPGARGASPLPPPNAMKAAGVRYQSYLYEGKQHAFHNDVNVARYDRASAELAWKRTLDLFKRTL